MVAYRLSTYGNPLRTEPARKPGRYHTGEEDSATQYVCLHPLGPLAEFMRANDLRRPEQVRQVRQRTWALRLEIDRLPEITLSNADDFGLDATSLVADDPSRCQDLGGRLRDEVPGIVVPSAALPGTRNVVLFGPRVGSPYLLDPVSEVDVPASVTAHAGRPILSLLDVVRFKGEPHAELESFEQGKDLELDEPDWELTQEQR
jgi:hypothetical protein